MTPIFNIKELYLSACRFTKKETFFFTVIIITFLIRFFALYGNSLLVEETYYWNYAQHFDFGYLDHPPMVAFLIKVSTFFFGLNEFSVRLSTFFCWTVAVFFNVKLTNLIQPRTGQYTFLFLSILPFFFLHSLIITPDAPLIACWSAALYYLYRSLVLDESKSWYLVGIWLGLGMLSKYTIVLLGGSAFFYMIVIPSARHNFLKKEPYLCFLIIVLLFTPVIYWNATHNWASFAFQSSRRFSETFHCSLHEFFGLLFFFLMPAGLYGLYTLMKKKVDNRLSVNVAPKHFMMIFTLLPLLFFGLFSIFHPIKFNWIGPGLLSLVPWLAISLSHAPVCSLKKIVNLRNSWIITSSLLILCYGLMIVSIVSGKPDIAQKKIFKKFQDWQSFALEVNNIAGKIEAQEKSTPIIIPLDEYNINSELTFYQDKLFERRLINKIYPLAGQHIFGYNSLMYQYWPHESPNGRVLILISDNFDSVNLQTKNKLLIKLTKVKKMYAYSQGSAVQLKPFFYRTALMR